MPRHHWTEIDITVLRRVYPTCSALHIAGAIGCSENAVYNKARKLGLKKSPAFIAETARQRSAQPDHGGRATRFQPGLVPHNKGMKHPPGWAPGRMAQGQFKPRAPHECRNYLPIGSLRITKDGLLERKTTDDVSLATARRWTAEHRLVWEHHYGPVPEGHAVVFRPGLRTTDPALITIDRLELLTRSDLMRRNTIHRYPPQVKDLIRLRKRLERAITTATEEARHEQ